MTNQVTMTDRCRDARFEFRAWNVRGDVIDHLESNAGLGKPSLVRDQYLVSPLLGVNVKIRAGEVKVKRLLDTRGEFEQWCPTWKTSTPLDHVGIVRLWGELGLPAPHSDTLASDTVETLASEDQNLIVVDVEKRRRHGTLDGVSAEVTEIKRDERTVITVALEDTDPERVRAVRTLAGLDRYDNVAVHVAVAHRWSELVGEREGVRT